MDYVERLLNHLSRLGYGSLATLAGRYYAMDRDKRYERTKLAYEGMVQGTGEKVPVADLTKVWYIMAQNYLYFLSLSLSLFS